MNSAPKNNRHRIDPNLYREIQQFGARDMEICMQCGNCSASCPLSDGNDTFPRKVYRYLQLGLRDKLLASPVPWLCYYCGECNKDCPRGAEPAETMMATRRWLTTQYDWTGLAKKLYLSEAWEIGALGAVALFIILLFVFFHGPVITDRMAVNTFAPVLWIEIGDLLMAAVLSGFLFSNAFRMYRFVMKGTKVPLYLYITQAREFVLHFATQKRWRKCSDDKTRWWKHFILVTGYMTMMTLIIGCIRWFQVDDSSWHFTSIFGYYATAALLYLTADMFISRMKKKEDIHRFSEPTDWLFLVLLFMTTLTGILMHIVRLAGWPMGTYVMYVIHLAIAVPMLVIEVPFGKWSHLFYRPLAIFLTTVREKAVKDSIADFETIREMVSETFLSCMQCGTCSGVCPVNLATDYNPRQMLRQLAHATGTEQSIDHAVWRCVTCNSCGVNCPRGINIIDVMGSVRQINAEHDKLPDHAIEPLQSLELNANPWNGSVQNRMDWAKGLSIPKVCPEHEYCLFTCCTTAFNGSSPWDHQKTVQMLPKLLTHADVSFGTLGTKERCCGDPAHRFGDETLSSALREKNTDLFKENGVCKIITTSPHCMDTFKKEYPGLNGSIGVEHYVEFLDRLIAKKVLQPIIETDRVVTFHDPCYLGRHNNIYDAPRNILKQIPGLKLVEMPSNREKSLCCGGGGANVWQKLPFEKRLNILRVKEALESGAQIIATACPFCLRILHEAVADLGVGDRIAVRDVCQILFESIDRTTEMKTPEKQAPGIDQEVYHG